MCPFISFCVTAKSTVASDNVFDASACSLNTSFAASD